MRCPRFLRAHRFIIQDGRASVKRISLKVGKKKEMSKEYLSCVHTHTEFCDGKSTMEQMVLAALEMKYESLGFSPHSPLPYENDWAMKKEDLPAYFAELARLKSLYGNRIDLLCGIEWDEETPDLPNGLDYVIGSVHSFSKRGIHFSVDYSRELLARVVKEGYDGDFLALCADYFELLVAHGAKKQVDILGHFDLFFKYNKDGCFLDENDPRYLNLACKAADELILARPDLYFEINVGGMPRAGRPYPYPAPPVLAHLAKRGARFVVTGDCHSAEQLKRGYGTLPSELARATGGRLYLLTSKGYLPF